MYPGNKTGKNPASGEKDPFEEKTGKPLSVGIVVGGFLSPAQSVF